MEEEMVDVLPMSVIRSITVNHIRDGMPSSIRSGWVDVQTEWGPVQIHYGRHNGEGFQNCRIQVSRNVLEAMIHHVHGELTKEVG